MQWSTSVGAWARREAVLVAALAAASAIVAFGVALGARWLTAAGLAIAAAGSIGRLVIALRRSHLERRREVAESVRRLRVPVGPIGDIDPTLIGVDRAAQTILRGGVRPEYLTREA